MINFHTVLSMDLSVRLESTTKFLYLNATKPVPFLLQILNSGWCYFFMESEPPRPFKCTLYPKRFTTFRIRASDDISKPQMSVTTGDGIELLDVKMTK